MSSAKSSKRQHDIVPLTEENYYTWSYEMQLVLQRKRLWKYVRASVQTSSKQYGFSLSSTETLLKGEGDSQEKSVEKTLQQTMQIESAIEEDAQACAIIGLNVTQPFYTEIRDCKNAYVAKTWRVL